jgi:hypothetical protein
MEEIIGENLALLPLSDVGRNSGGNVVLPGLTRIELTGSIKVVGTNALHIHASAVQSVVQGQRDRADHEERPSRPRPRCPRTGRRCAVLWRFDSDHQMAGRPRPPSSFISRLTLSFDPLLRSCWKLRRTDFQHDQLRHLSASSNEEVFTIHLSAVRFSSIPLPYRGRFIILMVPQARNEMRALFVVLAVALSVATKSAAQETISSVGFMLPHCKLALNGKSKRVKWYEPVCYGEIDALAFVGTLLNSDDRFCMPVVVAREEALRVVVRYLEAHPEAKNENFKIMALAAMKGEWPCQ